MVSKDELVQDGYTFVGKYDEELSSYYKLSAKGNVQGVSYYFVNTTGKIVGNENFMSKKDISLAVNLQQKIANKQKRLFGGTIKKLTKNKK